MKTISPKVQKSSVHGYNPFYYWQNFSLNQQSYHENMHKMCDLPSDITKPALTA